MIAFYTGHGRFRRHLQNMRIIDESKCKFCDEDETAEHVMCKCDRNQNVFYKISVHWNMKVS